MVVLARCQRVNPEINEVTLIPTILESHKRRSLAR